ncbi:MAG: hypothetical protein K9J27_11010 [Bacteroidales bacterium]|nr:hypothetical protein [Bacteroidales bacterium]MCF8338811.1 hypothetical protein [Bacteroidales bacterium]
MQGVTHENILAPEEKSILNTLLYFDVFDHPLSHEELYQTCSVNGTAEKDFGFYLDHLQKLGLIGEASGLFFLEGKQDNVTERMRERTRVKKYYRMARFMTRIIASFPFVRGVFVSGSLSKMRAAKDGDIDYFVVTKPGRLWISRTMLMIFKKLFLFNSYKYFCLNYFVDDHSLHIESRDLYIATEIITLVPLYNSEIYHNFMEANQWAKRFYPYAPRRASTYCVKPLFGFLKRVMEKVFDNDSGNKLDDFLMKKTLNYRQRKFSWLSTEQFEKAFITRKNASKHHPEDFRDKVLKKFREKQKWFEQKHKIHLHYDKKNKNHFYDVKKSTSR